MCQKPAFDAAPVRRDGSPEGVWEVYDLKKPAPPVRKAPEPPCPVAEMSALRFWGRYALYPAAWALARASGAGEHLMPMIFLGTLLRYAVHLVFTVLSKLDSFSEPVRAPSASLSLSLSLSLSQPPTPHRCASLASIRRPSSTSVSLTGTDPSSSRLSPSSQ